MIDNRAFIKATQESAWCSDDPFMCSVDGDETRAILFDLWKDHTRDGITARVTFNAIGISWTRDFQFDARTLREVAQFILRKLRSLDPTPPGPARFQPKAKI